MPISLYPVLFMLLSTLTLSISSLLTKYLSAHLAAQWIGFSRFALPAVILLTYLAVKGSRMPDSRMYRSLLIRSISIAGSQMCFIYSLQVLSLVESVVLFSTGPLFIPLLERVMFGVKLRWQTVTALLITFAGVIMMSGDVTGFHWRAELLAGLMAGVFNAGSQLSLFRATKSDMKPTEINAWSFTFAALILSPLLIIMPSPVFSVAGQPETSLMVWVFVSLVVMAVLVINTQLFRARAYQLASSSSQLAPLIFTNLLFSTIWQMLFFNVTYSPLQRAGLALVIIATIGSALLPPLLRKLFDDHSSGRFKSA